MSVTVIPLQMAQLRVIPLRVALAPGATVHGLLTGLADDDHAQYHTDARGDARYSLLAHAHAGVYDPAGSAATATATAAAALAVHAAAGDPHPQYLTPAEADAAYQPAGAVSGTINGLLTLNNDSGGIIHHNTASDPNSGGALHGKPYNFDLFYSAGPRDNGPPSETNYVDDVWAWGINVGNIGTKALATEAYAAWHLESKFYQNASQLSPYLEHFLTFIPNNSNTNYRPIAFIAAHDGSYSNAGFNAHQITFQTLAASPRLDFDFRAANACSVYNGFAFNYLTNNQPVARQTNAANNSSFTLPYIDDNNNLVVSSPISNVATNNTASGPTLTSRGTNTLGAAIQAPGAVACVLDISCGTGAGKKNATFGVDAAGNVVFAQVSTGGALYFDFNGDIFFRDKNAGYAQRLHMFQGSLGIGTTYVTGAKLAVDGPVRFKSYTVATVPSASAAGAGSQIYVSNESGGAVMAFSDGTAWRRVTDRAVVS